MNKYAFLLIGFFLLLQANAEGADPTRPPNFNVGQESARVINNVWELEAIFISSQKKIAIINGQTVQEGDPIMGAIVYSIEPNVVQLDGSSGRITLFLLENLQKSNEKG